MSATSGWELVTSDRLRSQILSLLRRRALRRGASPSDGTLRRAAVRIERRLFSRARPAGPARVSPVGGVTRLFSTVLRKRILHMPARRAGAGVWRALGLRPVQEAEFSEGLGHATARVELHRRILASMGADAPTDPAVIAQMILHNQAQLRADGSHARKKRQTHSFPDLAYLTQDGKRRVNVEIDTTDAGMRKHMKTLPKRDRDAINIFAKTDPYTGAIIEVVRCRGRRCTKPIKGARAADPAQWLPKASAKSAPARPAPPAQRPAPGRARASRSMAPQRRPIRAQRRPVGRGGQREFELSFF